MDHGNQHHHVWGSNDKIYFCLECGTTREKEEPMDGPFGPIHGGPLETIMYPVKDSSNDIRDRSEKGSRGPKGGWWNS